MMSVTGSLQGVLSLLFASWKGVAAGIHLPDVPHQERATTRDRARAVYQATCFQLSRSICLAPGTS